MLVSFFPTSAEVGIDYSYTPATPDTPAVLDEDSGDIITPMIPGVPAKGHPDCIGVYEVDFDPTTQTVSLVDGEVIVTDKPIPPQPPETPQEKHTRVYQDIVNAENLAEVDLEGEIFTDFEIGEIITARVFGGNPHAEKAITNKVLAVTLALLQGVEMTEGMASKIADATAKKEEVDAVRNLFNLGNL